MNHRQKQKQICTRTNWYITTNTNDNNRSDTSQTTTIKRSTQLGLTRGFMKIFMKLYDDIHNG